MIRCSFFLVVVALVATLILPAPGDAGVPRVRALAGGDARLLPDDDGTIGVFPNRLSEHRRIVLHNLAPNALGGIDPDSLTLDDILDSESWAEVSWAWGDGTAQWGVNRPTASTLGQTVGYLVRQAAGAGDVPGARSLVDFGYASGSWGVLGNFGLATREDQDSNWFFEGIGSAEVGDGELAGRFTVNNIQIPVTDPNTGLTTTDNNTVISFGADARQAKGIGSFDRSVLSASFTTDSETDVNVFALDATIFDYNGDGGGGSSLTHLIALGGSIINISGGGASATLLAIPTVTAGGEYSPKSWLDLRGSVTRTFTFTLGDAPSASEAGPTITTLGASAHWGKFSVDAVVNNDFFEDGPDFIGGVGNGVSSFVSMEYSLD